MGATIIIKRILNLGINLTIGKLLAYISAVKKHLTKTISEDEVVQFHINNLGLAKVLEALISYFWYSIRSPKAKICLKNGFNIIAFLDAGIEINVMIKELIKDVNLAKKRELKLE